MIVAVAATPLAAFLMMTSENSVEMREPALA
jgi:hypothetical protein